MISQGLTVSGKKYFAASNSGSGFKSYFNELFFNNDIKRRYIIKGGPGTGKSTLMRRVGERAEREGRDVEYYYCSSDSSSLDGVVVDSSTAIFDGTSPHSYDTVLPGAVDEIVDLGRFWNSDALSRVSEQIRNISSVKKSCYGRAYRYLAASREVYLALEDLVLPYVDRAKLVSAVRRVSERIESGMGARITPLAVSAVGVHGRVRFDSLERASSELYGICDSYGTAKIYLEALVTELLRKGCRLRVAYDPIDTDAIEAVLVENSGECFYVSREEQLPPEIQKINMRRFLFCERLAEIRGEYRSGEKQIEALITLAEGELSGAGEAHARLEKIYSDNMDFDALNAFLGNFIEKII